MFTKAGRPGWPALIPIYNVIVLLGIIGRPGWLVVLLLIPLANLVIWIMLCYETSKSYGRGVGYAIGLWCLPFIFFPLLGFTSARYRGPWHKRGQEGPARV